jgi:hypothetical protein
VPLLFVSNFILEITLEKAFVIDIIDSESLALERKRKKGGLNLRQ